MAQGIRQSTNRTYTSGQKCYLQFCSLYSLPPLPASEKVILCFVTFLKSKLLSINSIHVYLAAVRSLHVMNGFDPPATNTPRVKLALKAILESNPPPAQAIPITYKLLVQLCDKLLFNYDDILWKAVFTVAFFGGLRSNEYAIADNVPCQEQKAPLSLAQVNFGTDPKGLPFMALQLNTTKTTPHGTVIPIGCSTTAVCAVCFTKHYLSLRHATRRCHSAQPLFLFANGRALSKSILNSKLKELVSALGLNPSGFSSHSLRAGVTSSAACASATPFQAWELKSLGHWKSDSYQRYIRNVDAHRLYFAQRIAHLPN